MTSESFVVALRFFTRRRHFQPFFVELVGGDRFRVSHPGALSMRGPLAVYIAPDHGVKLFDSECVSQLSDFPAQTSA
jgi:hypothetical protein